MSEFSFSEAPLVGQILLPISSVFFLVCIPALVMVAKRRTVQPLKARSPSMLVISGTACALMCLNAGVQELMDKTYPCFGNVLQQWYFFPFFFLPYMFRSMRLFFVFRLSQRKAALDQMDKRKTRVFMNKRRTNVYTEKLLIVYLLIACFPFNAWGVYISIVNWNEWSPTNFNCPYTFSFYTNVIIYLMVYLLVLLAAMYFLRDVHDAFNMNSELRLVSILFVVTIVPYALVNNFYNAVPEVGDPAPEPRAPVGVFTVVWGIGAFSLSILNPLYRSYVSPPEIVLPAGVKVDTLDEVLSNKISREAFRDFLVSEFSVENLLFYEEVTQFKKMEHDGEPGGDVNAAANQIFEKYIIPNAILEINLDGYVREKIVQELDAPTFDVYNKAQEQIFKLMQTDSFPRFKRSKQFADAVAVLQKGADEARKILDNDLV